MRILKRAIATSVLLLSIFFPLAASFSLANREEHCPATYQLCTPSSGHGPDFCCPNDTNCGPSSGSCVQKSHTTTTVNSKSQSTVIDRETRTLAPTPTSATATPAQSSSVSSPKPASSKPSSNPGFFTTRNIVIIAASGAAFILLLSAIGLCCYRARRNGRALALAYEDPERTPYSSVYVVSTKSLKSQKSAGSRITSRNLNDTALPSPSLPSPPTPAYDIDVNSPSSPAFAMTPQTPVGPLDGGNNSTYYQTGHFLNPAYTAPAVGDNMHPAHRGTPSSERHTEGNSEARHNIGLYVRPEPTFMIPPRSTSLPDRPLVSPISPVRGGRVMFAEAQESKASSPVQAHRGVLVEGEQRYFSPPPTTLSPPPTERSKIPSPVQADGGQQTRYLSPPLNSSSPPLDAPWTKGDYWYERR